MNATQIDQINGRDVDLTSLKTFKNIPAYFYKRICSNTITNFY